MLVLMVVLAKVLRKQGLSYRGIGTVMASRGLINTRGKQHDASAVRKMVAS
jgi:hypothetical protein